MKNKILIALDESTTSTGYAVFRNSTLIEHGIFSSKSKDVLERVSYIMEEIEKLITETILVGSIETNAGEQNESDRAPEFDFEEEFGKY